VSIAAFKLGSLYEHGVKRDDNQSVLLAPDESRAWTWYQEAADAGEPNALARFAERAEAASFSATDAGNRDAGLLEAFSYYAAAANRAQSEDWPDGAWRNWRYRRASLARLLARAGKMPEVAKRYSKILEQYAPPRPTLWSRLTTDAATDHD
jgi:TPR repeat protein